MEVETGGDDTNGSGAFDPGQTAGMFTDGAATVANTNSPIFSSASYNFVAGDVNAWIYIASGTIGATVAAGWYKILNANDGTSGANKALIDGTIGHAVLKAGTPSTVIGCANGASPTTITWTIDYSQQAAARYTFTHLTSVGTGLTVVGGTSGDHAFAKQDVGNSIVITGGTNFNTGRYVITAVSAGTATVVGPTNITTGAGALGTGSQGGALASPGQAGAVAVGNNRMFIKSGSTYSVTSATANITGGCVNWPASSGGNEGYIQGYQMVRGDYGTRPTIQASNSISTFKLIRLDTKVRIDNVIVDGANLTSSQGIGSNGNVQCMAYKCKAINCTNGGIVSLLAVLCEATTCTTTAAIASTYCALCWSHDNTIHGFTPSGNFTVGNTYLYCIASNNTGTSDGFSSSGSTPGFSLNCVAYGNSRDGFVGNSGSGIGAEFINCLAVNNVRWGFNDSNNPAAGQLFINCATFNNNTGGSGGSIGSSASPTIFNTQAPAFFGAVILNADPFVNAAANNFALNTVANGGALCRAAGIPGAFPAATITGYLDIGAAQSQPEAIPIIGLALVY